LDLEGEEETAVRVVSAVATERELIDKVCPSTGNVLAVEMFIEGFKLEFEGELRDLPEGNGGSSARLSFRCEDDWVEILPFMTSE